VVVAVVDVVVVAGGGLGLPPVTSLICVEFTCVGAGTVGARVMPGGGMWKRRSP
jgi:hypothetical protein